MRTALLTLAAAALAAAADPKHFTNLEYRFIGPANMGGRATDVEGVPGNPDIVYAGYGGSGLWKTTNGGHTWTPLFEKQAVYSIGDIALEPGNPEVIWAGTGESNTRNSVSFGDGIYRSTDGGKTWKHMGLRDSERISRVLVHPADPRTVWVAAQGHAFGPHSERGVFLTTDGGATWQKTLYVDDRHGAADLDVNPANPNILYAAMWKFDRKPWTHTSGSEQGGVFRSIDGGRTWSKLTKGLPKLMGRIGVKVAPSNPRVVYVIAESKDGVLFRSEDGGDSFTEVTRNRDIVSRGFYYADLRVDPANENRVYAVASTLYVSIDAGKTWKSIVHNTHIDYHSLWIDPRNPRRLWNANDGGIAFSNDAGATWEAVYNVALGQFYQVHADARRPFYSVMGGLQDNGSWTGPARTREPAGILNDDWRMVQFGDGFHMLNHPEDPDLYLSESQGGTVARTDMRTREAQLVTPYPVTVAGAPASEAKYRFNWNTPLIPSPHDANTVYLGGNVLFRSADFGRTWKAISPDLTTDDKEKQKTAGGPVWFDNSTAEYYCTIISIAESPVRRGEIWVGTDDGRIQMTPDGGASWTDLTAGIRGVPRPFVVTHVELPPRAGEAYVSIERHMFDDFHAYLFKTTDGGKTWTEVGKGLPTGAYPHVIREDPKNPKLLYAGTEVGLYVSWDAGATWSALSAKNLPAVAVHDIKIHPSENDLILATHGRSIAILDDVAALQQLDPSRPLQAFAPRTAYRFTSRFTRYGMGGAIYKGPNPPYGALLTYYLRDKPDAKAEGKIRILDAAGKTIREIAKIPMEAGVNRIAWDLKTDPPAARREAPADAGEEFDRGVRGYEVLPGEYTVRITVAGLTADQKVTVAMDPALKVTAADLRSRYETAQRLWKLIDAGNRNLKKIDSLKEQLERTGKLVKVAAIEGYQKDLAAQASSIARAPDVPRLEASPGFVEKLAGLYASVEGPNAAPTAAMLEAINELAPRFEEGNRAVTRFLEETVTRWNAELTRANAPALVR